MNSSARLALLLGLQLSVAASLIACGGDDDAAKDDSSADGGVKDPSGSTGTLQLTYAPMYSAFVENHEAQVPVMLKDPMLRGKGAKFTSSDPSIAVVQDNEMGALITVKKDGNVTISASLEGETGAAKLTISKFTEAQWMIGQARYSKSDLAINPKDGRPVSILSLFTDRTAWNGNGACNTCHTAQAKTLKIENGPTQIAGYSDDELITIFTKGRKPDGAVRKTQVPAFVWGMFHSWTVTEEEKQGLIAFLRTQAPKANPATIDYGVQPCPGSNADAGLETMYCDTAGNPLRPPRADGGTSAPTDAGVPSVIDAGTSSDDAAVVVEDAGTTDAG